MTGKIASEHEKQPVDPESLELAPGTKHEVLEGWIPGLADDAEIFTALEKAFDYRGDVTITRKDGSVIEGYIFDRRTGKSLADSTIRLFPKDSPEKMTIAYSEIGGLSFTGKDRAAGASWEAWVKKWQEKKAAGEKGFGLQPEKLD
ncbi:MAG TPA: hypothetical protein VHX11_07675 [Acidobacteriaceae bacterium]|jgi:hypothetical protein|nr:hypothetical protein [Acidobacteriaceae bacterium]